MIQFKNGGALTKPHRIRIFESDPLRVLFFCTLAGREIALKRVQPTANFAYGINDSKEVSLQGSRS